MKGLLEPPTGTSNLHFVVLGGGILGTAVAALAANSNLNVLVLRRHDHTVPRADTLRNQGWLQSGLLYPMQDFAGQGEFRLAGLTAFYGGREMLRACELPLPIERAVLRVVSKERIDDVEKKAKLLGFNVDEFRRLEPDEAQSRLNELFEPDSTYYQVPDAPFDEAGVLAYFRKLAINNGAQFIQVNEPVSLSRSTKGVQIQWGKNEINSPLTLIVAGAGSLPLLTQVGYTASASLRQTPMLVHPGTCGIDVPLLIDLQRGFSAVRHNSGGVDAIVIGTKVRLDPVTYTEPESRRIPSADILKFKACLHPRLAQDVATGRFTAGYEVIPKIRRSRRVTFVEPFVEDFGNVVFASPGRATLGLRAAEKVLDRMVGKLEATGWQTFERGVIDGDPWNESIEMHFAPSYNFNDAES